MDDSFRKMARPGDPCGALVRAIVEWVGDGKGDGCSCAGWLGSVGTAMICPRTGDIEVLPLVEARGVLAALLIFELEGESLAGNGNNGLLSLFRRGKRKKVVVVDIVWVVVVWA